MNESALSTIPRTWWMNDFTGEPLHADDLVQLRVRARALYEINTHIFEDEFEALAAIGVVPIAALDGQSSCW